MRKDITRRSFLKSTIATGFGMALGTNLMSSCLNSNRLKNMEFGLVTYQWGKDWDLPTLITNCEKAGIKAVELRTQHAHGVETTLSSSQREEVKKRFADSNVTCVGYGSNFEYHDPDPDKLRWNIEQSKEYVKLCSDIGSTGLKVKPNTLPDDVPYDKTIDQIATSLNEVGKFAQDWGQVIRVEAHGRKTQELPNMKAIFDRVTESNVKICWNSNVVDLNPPGFEENFNMVKQWIGDTVHVRELDDPEYPYQKLFSLLSDNNFKGWILLEASSKPSDILTALIQQKSYFDKFINTI
jgi:sugar phosphate isomerase/epimerase